MSTTSYTPSATTDIQDFKETLNPNLDILFGTICCICFISGTFGNFAAFFFFKYSKNNVPHSIYKIITATDFYISLCILPIGICYLTQRSPGVLFGTTVTCYIWGYTWSIVGRLSVFLVVVLNTTRTCLVLKPFHTIKIKVVVGFIIGYFLIMLVQMLLIQWFTRAKVIYKKSFAECVFFTSKKQQYKGLYFIGYTMPYIVPMFVIILSCGLTIYAIAVKPKRNDSHTQVQAASSARVTMTILIFTLVYSLFNIPLVFDRIILALRDLFDIKWFENLHNFENVDYYLNFTYSVSVAINSALNPWLYLWRMANFRRFLWDTVVRNGMLPARCQNAVDCSPGSYRAAGKGNNTLFETTSFINA